MHPGALIHLASEFSPIVAFFIASQFLDFFTATAIFIVVTVIALSVSWFGERRIALFPLISALFVVVFGLVTVVFKLPDAIIVSDTLYYALFGILIGIGVPKNRYLLKTLFESTFAMKDEGWRILSIRWSIVFFLAAFGNEIVRLFFAPEVWVQYKLVKVFIIAGFGIYQFTLARRYRLPHATKWGLRVPDSPTHSPLAKQTEHV